MVSDVHFYVLILPQLLIYKVIATKLKNCGSKLKVVHEELTSITLFKEAMPTEHSVIFLLNPDAKCINLCSSVKYIILYILIISISLKEVQ